MKNLDNIVTDDMMKMIFNTLDQVIEHIHQNTDESVDNDEFLGFIIEKLMKRYSNESPNYVGKLNEEKILESLHLVGNPHEVKNYLDAFYMLQPLTEGWTVEEFVNDFESWKISPKDYEGENFISEEELLKHRFTKNSK